MARAANFLDEMGAVFGFCQERIPGKGEDSCCYRFCEAGGVMAVFDGCGGSGAQSYSRLGGHSGAYLASRAAAAGTVQWFDEQLAQGGSMDVEALKGQILSKLSVCEGYSEQSRGKIRGSIVRSLPTTMAGFAFARNGGRTLLSAISAGDSHLYLLDGSGLMQLNEDDVVGGDAFTNLYDDSPMTNVISLDGDFTLHESRFALEGSCVLIAATDGCFGYLKSPMEFELLLLDALMGARNVDEWQEGIAHAVDAAAGDDQTLLALIYGYGGFAELRRSLEPRRALLSRQLADIDGASDALEARKRIWETYRQGYYAIQNAGGESR